ncbi:MAG: hypothetical protein IH991_13065 [Planctomycetes bacterium]|nr:hypothetical protein [Planctomycetota bacterium]
MVAAWVEKEFQTLDLEDKRRDRRVKIIVDQFARVAESTPDACRDIAALEATYRIANNSSVSPDDILKAHHRATIERTADHACVVLAQDTTLGATAGSPSSEHGCVIRHCWTSQQWHPASCARPASPIGVSLTYKDVSDGMSFRCLRPASVMLHPLNVSEYNSATSASCAKSTSATCVSEKSMLPNLLSTPSSLNDSIIPLSRTGTFRSVAIV